MSVALADPLPVRCVDGPFDTTIVPPGSKSITCRAYLLAALADGTSRIERPLRSADTDGLLEALATLGAAARWDGDDVLIEGVGGRFPEGGEVNLGDGGTPSRFMLAAACLADGEVTVDGSPRMRERPVAEGVAFLRRLGATIDYVQHEGFLPVRVRCGHVEGGALDVPTTMSSQFISALLLIAPWLPAPLELRYRGDLTSASYVRLTERVLEQWGVEIEASADVTGHRVSPGPLAARTFAVEPDASSAVYWWTAALLVPGARVQVPGLGATTVQPDAGYLDFFRHVATIEQNEDVTVVTGRMRSGLGPVDASNQPDAALSLAAYAAMADPSSGGAAVTRIEGLRTLRVKETDRIAALANELQRIGCTVETTPDTLTIDPTTRHERPVEIETYRDHRMAMAFAILGLVRPGVAIRDPGCVDKSYPGFWSDLARLYDK